MIPPLRGVALSTVSPAVAPWVLVALAAAGAQTVYATLQKRLTVDVDTLRLSYVTAVLGTALLGPLAGWVALGGDLAVAAGVGFGGDIGVTRAVILAIVVSGLANVGALVAYLTALERADLSVVSPLRQSTPVFVAGLEPLVLATRFDPTVLLAALAVVAGGYVLLAEGESLATPLARLVSGGPLLAVVTAVLFAVASVASRFVVVRMPPLVYTAILYAFMAAAYAVLTTWRGSRPSLAAVWQRRFLALGIATSARSLLIFLAFSLVAAARATVVFRVSVLLNVLVGGILLAEAGLARRLVGAVLVVVGVAIAV